MKHLILSSRQGQGSTYDCFECNDEISYLYKRDICIIGFDSASQKTKIVWEKVDDAGIDGYIIRRGVNYIVDSIDYVSETMSGEYIDYTSSPMQYAEQYAIVPVDSCGNESNVNSLVISTVFLQTYPAGPNIVNLNWNSAGPANPSSFENATYIYRGNSPSNLQIIDTIPIGVINYSDITAPPGQQYYAIERRRLFPCNPLRVSNGSSYSSSMSNPSAVTVTGLQVIDDENFIHISPNPVTNTLHLGLSHYMLNRKISLSDVSGKIFYTGLIKGKDLDIDVSELASGSYWITVVGESKWVKKFVITR